MAVVPVRTGSGGDAEQKGEGDVSEGIHGWPSGEQAISMQPVLELEIDVQSLPKQVNPPDFWQETAACYGLDPEIFFPTTEEEAGLALSYCGMCSVREVCLAWAIQNGERYGVWGGTTEQHRRRLIRHVA
jgi:WhiB family transcriptional regulator, redox-sensing transcriptional regulator